MEKYAIILRIAIDRSRKRPVVICTTTMPLARSVHIRQLAALDL
jgi:hypothetical protein